MGTYKTRCPFCIEKFDVNDEQAGTVGQCPRCGKEFEIQPKLSISSATSPNTQSPLAQQTNPGRPPIREEASGLRPRKKKRGLSKRTKRTLTVFLLLILMVGGGYLGVRWFLFSTSGFNLVEESDETQIYISGHGLFLKAEKNEMFEEPEEEVYDTEKVIDDNKGWNSVSYRHVQRSYKPEPKSEIKKIFSEKYSGVLNLPEQNMTWGRLEVKSGLADGSMRIYRFRRGREVMTDEWLFKSGRMTRYYHQPAMGSPRTILLKYDFLGRFQYAVENNKIIARAIYDYFSRLQKIIIVYPTGKIVQHYKDNRVILEKRYNKDRLELELRYQYDPQTGVASCDVFDANSRPVNHLSKSKKVPSLSLLRTFRQRELFKRRPRKPHATPAPQWSPEPPATIPEKIADDMTRPVTQQPKTSVDAHPEVAE